MIRSCEVTPTIAHEILDMTPGLDGTNTTEEVPLGPNWRPSITNRPPELGKHSESHGTSLESRPDKPKLGDGSLRNLNTVGGA